MSKNQSSGSKGGAGKNAPAAQPPKAQTWILFAIWMVLSWYMLKSCSPQTQAKVVQQSDAQLLTQLQDQNKKLLEADAAQTNAKYQQQLIDESKTANPPKDLLKKQIEGNILVADAQLRGAIKTGNYHKYDLSYQTLVHLDLTYAKDPEWTQEAFAMPSTSDPSAIGLPRSWTGHGLFEKIVTLLSEQNRTSPVYGFIPGYAFINLLVHMTGAIPAFSYWFAPLVLALVVRSIVWPLTQKQLRSSRQMQQLVPRTKEIKAQFPNDMAEQQRRTMELYKEYGINPMAGCLPLLIQMPFFFAVYQCMLRYRFDFTKGTFLWINPSIAPLTHGFTAPNLGQQDNLLIIIYGITMAVSQYLMPIGDPSQAKQQRIMGIAISIIIPITMMTGAFPVASAFVLYWTFTNIFATTQSLIMFRKPVEKLVPVLTIHNGAIPKSGATTLNRKPTFMERMQAEMERRYEAQQSQNGSTSNSNGASKNGNSKNGSGGKDGSTGIWKSLQEDAAKRLAEQEARKQNGGGPGDKPKPKKRN